jgi:hypothetical protein
MTRRHEHHDQHLTGAFEARLFDGALAEDEDRRPESIPLGGRVLREEALVAECAEEAVGGAR